MNLFALRRWFESTAASLKATLPSRGRTLKASAGKGACCARCAALRGGKAASAWSGLVRHEVAEPKLMLGSSLGAMLS